MADRVRTFRNVRARVLIVEDGHWYSGWTKHLGHDEARIRMKTFVPLLPGCPMVGECYGDGVRVRFVGTALGQMGQDVAIKIRGGLGFADSEEAIRIGVEGVSGTLAHADAQWELLVMDVSPESMGVLTSEPVPTGDALDLRVATPLGDVCAKASVIHCRKEQEQETYYRVALRIVELSRLDKARWHRFLDELTQA